VLRQGAGHGAGEGDDILGGVPTLDTSRTYRIS